MPPAFKPTHPLTTLLTGHREPISTHPQSSRIRDRRGCGVETQERSRIDNGEHVEVRGGHIEAREYPLRRIRPSSKEEH